MAKDIKTGVDIGGGPPPGYGWNIDLIDLVVREGRDVLSEIGYEHLSRQFRELARTSDPTRSDVVDVRALLGEGDEKIYEVRDKGGVFGGANIRVFFGVDRGRRVIVPLGVIKRQNTGKTPRPALITARRRWRKYRDGDYGFVSRE